MKHCIICKKEDGKYKCPMCLVYYCSVDCCNKHRNNKCKLVEKPAAATTAPLKEKVATNEHETGDTIPTKRLKLMDKDENLKNILDNPHLRNLLVNIDNSEDPQGIMQKAMLEPIFVEFADACLRIVEPPDNDNN